MTPPVAEPVADLRPMIGGGCSPLASMRKCKLNQGRKPKERRRNRSQARAYHWTWHCKVGWLSRRHHVPASVKIVNVFGTYIFVHVCVVAQGAGTRTNWLLKRMIHVNL